MTMPVSFVGREFQTTGPITRTRSRAGKARFFALGTTSLKRGYYFLLAGHHPMDEIQRRRSSSRSISTPSKASWQGDDYEILVSDPEGIVFMTDQAEWLYSSLKPLDRRPAGAHRGLAPLRQCDLA
jgi:two-component system C4-dicarboxylate transport sensor histidine kinase DctB